MSQLVLLSQLMSDMFEKMENAFMFADLHLFINVVNGEGRHRDINVVDWVLLNIYSSCETQVFEKY